MKAEKGLLCLPVLFLTMFATVSVAEEHTAAMLAEMNAERMVLESKKRQADMECDSLYMETAAECKAKAAGEYQGQIRLLEQDPAGYFKKKKGL